MSTHRLPSPGSDEGTWGDILNDFLAQSHDTTGALKPGAVTDAGAITQTLADGRYVAGVKQATAPSSPSTDDLWYDKANDVWKRWNGTAWVAAGVSQSTLTTQLNTYAPGGSIGNIGTAIADGRYARTVKPSGDTTGVTDTAAIQAMIDAGTPFTTASGIFYVNGLVLKTAMAWNMLGSTLRLPNNAASGSRIIISERYDALMSTATVSSVSAANPGVVTTTAAHQWITGDTVIVSGVVGISNVNALVKTITVIDSTHFSIGNATTGTYTSGGTIASAGGGANSWSIVGHGIIDGNSANNSSSGDNIAVYGYGFQVRGMRSIRSNGRAARFDWNSVSFPSPSGSCAYVSDCEFASSLQGGLLWNGPNDSKLHHITTEMNDYVGFHVGPNADGLYADNIHSWSGAGAGVNQSHAIPYLIEADCQLSSGEANSLSTSPSTKAQVLCLSSCRILGFYAFQAHTDNTIPGIQIGTTVAIPEALGPGNAGSLAVASVKVMMTRVNGCGLGAVYFANSAGSNIVEGLTVFQQAVLGVAGPVIGNQAGMLQSDQLGTVAFSGGCTGPRPGSYIAMASTSPTTDAVAGTSYTLLNTDALRTKQCTSSSGAVTITIPTQATMAASEEWGAGLNVPFLITQTGTSKVTIQGDSGVTVQSLYGATPSIRGQYGTVVLQMVSTDVWQISGAITS